MKQQARSEIRFDAPYLGRCALGADPSAAALSMDTL